MSKTTIKVISLSVPKGIKKHPIMIS